MTTLFDRHAANARRLDEEGVATDLGPATALTPDALASAVEVLLTDPMERQGMARCGRQLIDGRGPDRLVCALEVLLHPAQTAGAAAGGVTSSRDAGDAGEQGEEASLDSPSSAAGQPLIHHSQLS